MANASSLFGRQAPTKASARCHGRAAAASRAPQSPCCRTLRRSAAAERLKTHANDENAVSPQHAPSICLNPHTPVAGAPRATKHLADHKQAAAGVHGITDVIAVYVASCHAVVRVLP